MENSEKRDIFERYDFSKTAQLKKAGIKGGDPKKELYHDIAGIIQSLFISLSAITTGEVKDIKEYQNLQDSIYMDYGWLQIKYLGIEWQELDSGDRDFSIFFKTKRLIDDLGRSIDPFLETWRRYPDRTMDSDESYKKIQEHIKEIGELMQEYLAAKERLTA